MIPLFEKMSLEELKAIDNHDNKEKENLTPRSRFSIADEQCEEGEETTYDKIHLFFTIKK